MPTCCLLLLAVLIATGSADEEERHRSNYTQPLYVKYAWSNYQNKNLGPVVFPSESNENGSPTSQSASEDLNPVLSSARGTQKSEVEYHMRVEDSSAAVRDEPTGPAFMRGYEPHVEYSPDWERRTARYKELAAARRPTAKHYSRAHYFPHPVSTAYADREPPVLEAPPTHLKLLNILNLPTTYL